MRLDLPTELEKYRSDLEKVARPAARILPTSEERSPLASKFGGVPFTPADFTWPTASYTATRGLFKKRVESWTRSLWFIAQVNFAEIHKQCPELHGFDWGMPADGLFQVFYDLVEQPWGFKAEHANSWKFVWYPSTESLNHVPSADLESYPKASVGMRFESILSTPDEIADFVEMSEVDEEIYNDRLMDLEPAHQVGGWSLNVQNPPFYNLPPDAGLASTPEEHDAIANSWRLVLQVDSDEKRLGYMWGDVGKLYIGVRDIDLSAGDLSRPWLELQCH